jgi:hypothetical protein
LNGWGNFLQKRDFAQISARIGTVAQQVLLLRKNLERLQKRNAERNVAKRRLGERRLANLEHDLKIARKTADDNKFKPIFLSRSIDLLQVPATLSQLAKSIEDSDFFRQICVDLRHWASFEKRDAIRLRTIVPQERVGYWLEPESSPARDIAIFTDHVQSQKTLKAIQDVPG